MLAELHPRREVDPTTHQIFAVRARRQRSPRGVAGDTVPVLAIALGATHGVDVGLRARLRFNRVSADRQDLERVDREAALFRRPRRDRDQHTRERHVPDRRVDDAGGVLDPAVTRLASGAKRDDTHEVLAERLPHRIPGSQVRRRSEALRPERELESFATSRDDRAPGNQDTGRIAAQTNRIRSLGCVSIEGERGRRPGDQLGLPRVPLPRRRDHAPVVERREVVEREQLRVRRSAQHSRGVELRRRSGGRDRQERAGDKKATHHARAYHPRRAPSVHGSQAPDLKTPVL